MSRRAGTARRLRLPLLLASVLLSALAQAQGTISSGSTFLQIVGAPFGTTAGNANLLFGSPSAFGTEQLFRMGWSYNQGVATSNRPFSGLDTPVASYIGNTATYAWTNAGAGAAGFARWNAVLTVTLTELAPGVGMPGQARVDSVLAFTAAPANAGPVAYGLFHDLDLDIAGSSGPGGDTYRVLDATAVQVRAFDASGPNFAEVLASGAARYEFNSGSALRSKLGVTTGAGTGNLLTLAGTAAPDWASTDGAVAFQWTPVLAPGESVQIASSFTINTPVPEPSAAALLGAGLALGLAAARRRARRG